MEQETTVDFTCHFMHETPLTILPYERATITRHTELVLSMSESELRRSANNPDSDLIKALELGGNGPYRQFWIPFDDVNEDADIVIVGLTPGFSRPRQRSHPCADRP